jgi:hypothetical protein
VDSIVREFRGMGIITEVTYCIGEGAKVHRNNEHSTTNRKNDCDS